MIETRKYEAAEQEQMISDIIAMQATPELDRFKRPTGKEYIPLTIVNGLTDKVRSALKTALPNVYDTASTMEYFPNYCKTIQKRTFNLEDHTIVIDVDFPHRLSAYMNNSGFPEKIKNLADKGARVLITANNGYPDLNIAKIASTFYLEFPQLLIISFKSTEGHARRRENTEAVFSLPNNFDYHR